MTTLLPTRSLGPLTVSAIGLGCMNLSHAYGVPPADTEAVTLLNRALDVGITLLDTAALYGGGGNERLLGRAVMHRRQEFTLASKCVLDLDDGRRTLDGSPAAIARGLDRALTRLGTDHIDLYYLHRLDPKVPIEDSVGALARAQEAGKIGALGLSEMSAATIARAQAVHPIAAVQSEYSPTVRNPEVAVLEHCRMTDIGFVAFSPVARGLLAGARLGGYAARDIRSAMPRFNPPHLAANLALAAQFSALAREAGMTPAQLALGWCLSRGAHVVPIPGTTSLSHLEENVAAATLPCPPDLIAAVDRLLPRGAARGARYNAAAQAQIDTELLPNEELA